MVPEINGGLGAVFRDHEISAGRNVVARLSFPADLDNLIGNCAGYGEVRAGYDWLYA